MIQRTRTKKCERCGDKYETIAKRSMRCEPCRKIVNTERAEERYRRNKAAGIKPPRNRPRTSPECTYHKVSSYRPSRNQMKQQCYEDIVKIINAKKYQGAEPTGWAWLENEILEKALLGTQPNSS